MCNLMKYPFLDTDMDKLAGYLWNIKSKPYGN